MAHPRESNSPVPNGFWPVGNAATARKLPRVSRARRSRNRRLTHRGGRIQDIGAQSIVPLLRLEPGHTFLDLCAAPGNKTAQALETGIDAIAADLHFHRAAQLKSLGIPVVVLDGTQPLPFARRFDRILVDAPCSGTGTLARNPEIKWRLTPDDLADLPRRQTALLANARAASGPGRAAGLFHLLARTGRERGNRRYRAARTVARDLSPAAGTRCRGWVLRNDNPIQAMIKSRLPANG